MRSIRGIFLLLSFLAVTLATSLHPVPAQAATPSLKLKWTAPGDDGIIGRATKYDLRYSLTPITMSTFATATPAPGLPAPSVAGKPDSVTIKNLVAGASYYFALKTADERNNWSVMSNVVLRSGSLVGVESEDPVVGIPLSLEAPWPNPAGSVTHIAYSLPTESDVAANVFDITGRHVKEIASGRRSAGRGEFVWNLRDDTGHTVRPGIYLVQTRMAGHSWTHRITVAT